MPKKSPFNPDASYEELRFHPKEMSVRAIVNSSVDDGKLTIKLDNDLATLEEALKREASSAEPRKGILTPLTAKIKKLKKQTTLDITVDEVKAPDIWQPARDYYSMAQRLARASVACQVMLGFQLIEIKKKLGYVQGGKRKPSKTESASVLATWEDHCKAELGITDRTARTYMTMAEGAKRKLKSCFSHLPLLDQPVTNYSDEQLKMLEKAVNKITDGHTQSEFMIECGIAKKPQGSAAKGGDQDKSGEEETTEPTMQQLAFALFSDPIHSLSILRTNTDDQKTLLALPVEQSEDDPVSLISIQAELEAMLADVKSTIKSNLAAAE